MVFFCGAASFAIAGQFNSRIITSDGDPLTLSVPDRHFLRIATFTQEGGSQRGVVAATANGRTTNVLSAVLIDQADASVPPESIKKVLIAGPAQVTIAPVPDATLFITYIRQPNGPAPTPTPTATVAPTATPTPTPTATP